ncbi:MAG TPA: sugar phosphate isomerase/epimerase [Armatimonadota bacterium]|nr:sugar phosphate isomerase/epimerase [Armatimonadota bacterium]
MQLAFSTLGCPEWTFDQILATAQELGYEGIEFRGLLSEIELDKTAEFMPGHIANTRKRLEDAEITPTCLSSSVQVVAAARDDVDEHRAIATAETYIDMAKEVGAPFVRIFCGNPPTDMDVSVAEDKAMSLLRKMGDYAQDRNITVVVETHDAYTDSRKLGDLIRLTNHPAVKILWDIHHPYRMSGESVVQTVEQIGRYVRYTHVKDSAMDKETEDFSYVLTGKGDVPIRETIHALHDLGYDGFLTLEWEKRWHPDLAAPEVCFAQYIKQMREWLANLS